MGYFKNKISNIDKFNLIQKATLGIVMFKTNYPKQVLLTFDDSFGDNPEWLFDLLNKLEIKAVFFLTGEYLKKNVNLTKKALDYGHSIGNHSFLHDDFSKINIFKIYQSIKKTDVLINKEFGKFSPVFRPPFGVFNLKVFLVSLFLKRKILMWNTKGFEFNGFSKEELFDNYVNSINMSDGCIVLIHPEMKVSLSILEDLLNFFKKNEFKFISLEEIFQ